MCWGVLLAAIFALLYAAAGSLLIGLFTDVRTVAQTAVAYLPYMVMVPVVSFVAFLCDGIFIGTSQTRQMLQTMLGATATFFAVYYLAPQGWGNNALWAAFLAYLFVRSIVAYWLSSSIAVKKS
jgi:MATE family multidrug resistance protein